jgi:hypothetical protein
MGKMAYFKKHWPEDLQADVLVCAESVVCCISLTIIYLYMLAATCPQFKTRYLEMQTSASAPQPCEKKGKASGLKKLIRETQSSDEDEEMCNSTSTADMDPARRWRSDFLNYLNTSDGKLPPGMSTIQWWGVCIYFIGLFLLTNTDSLVLLKVNGPRYGPVWSSIARDYLSIMASSVSSERAFSQGGITITKHRNRLKGDIVEALQCFKCALRHNLLFRTPGPSSVLEGELDEDDVEDESGKPGDHVHEESWDALLEEEGETDSA